MKKIVLVAGLLALSACYRAQPTQSNPDDMPTLTQAEETNLIAADPMADPTGDGNEMTESDLDNSSEAMMAEKESDDEKERLIEYVNPSSTNGVYVLRDKATGCEFIQSENNYSGGSGRSMGLLARPDGHSNSGQRGCGTGTDFKK